MLDNHFYIKSSELNRVIEFMRGHPGYFFENLPNNPDTYINSVPTMYNHSVGEIKIAILFDDGSSGYICLSYSVDNGNKPMNEALMCNFVENFEVLYDLE
ncbi:hypothetical protein ACW5XF_02270 [Aeromonas lusitana]|uniref:hypothetical protein n=1 Tax=Aeromonas lusitana TaxID=931529 RepID=UPI0012FE430C|nr:hypothetical protein [Aeromonas lusitana]